MGERRPLLPFDGGIALRVEGAKASMVRGKGERAELDTGSSRREDGEDQAPGSCEGWTDRAQGPEPGPNCGSGRPWLQAVGRHGRPSDGVRKTPGRGVCGGCEGRWEAGELNGKPGRVQ